MEELLNSWGKADLPERWAAFYVRVTQEESVKTDLSIPNQIARAKEIATTRGWSHWRIYVEPRHVSGELWINKRPALRELVHDVQSGRVSAVCARHTDRLWRTADIQGKLLTILREHAVELWDFSVRHEYKTAHGRFSLQVLGAVAELEVNLTAERIREMKRGKAHRGKTGGGPPPFGYTSQSRRILDLRAAGMADDDAYAKACVEFPIGKRWYVDDGEAETVRLIFQLYTDPKNPLGAKRIARILNERRAKSRMGFSWLGPYISRLIANPAYAGFTSFDEAAYEKRVKSSLPRARQELFKGEHDPLVPSETWQRAQTLREATATTLKGRWKPSGRVYCLTGILRCPGCKSRMIGKHSSHSTSTYYVCARRHNGGPELCAFRLLDAHQIHRKVWDWVFHKVISSPEYALEHLGRLQKAAEESRPKVEKEVGVLRRRAEELRGALRKYFGLLEGSADGGEDVFVTRVKELQAELRRVDEESTKLQAQVPPPAPQISLAQLQSFMSALRSKAGDRPSVQKALYLELKRKHGFRVTILSQDEIAITLPLPEFGDDEARGNLTNGRDRSLYSVVGSDPTDTGGSRVTGLPLPGGPTRSRL
jgi:site-specific DNA recombinase